jgi:hypothetical protein
MLKEVIVVIKRLLARKTNEKKNNDDRKLDFVSYFYPINAKGKNSPK